MLTTKQKNNLDTFANKLRDLIDRYGIENLDIEHHFDGDCYTLEVTSSIDDKAITVSLCEKQEVDYLAERLNDLENIIERIRQIDELLDEV